MHKAYWKSLATAALLLWGGWMLYPSYTFYSKPRAEQEKKDAEGRLNARHRIRQVFSTAASVGSKQCRQRAS